MDRSHFYSIMNGEGTLDYENLFEHQGASFLPKGFQGFLQRDELQFQVSTRWKKCG